MKVKQNGTFGIVFGLETKFGPVIVRMPQGSTYAYVEAGRFEDPGFYEGKAHVNDDRPALEYRGDRYVGSVRLYCDGGVWEAREAYPGGNTLTRGYAGEAPRTYQAAMVSAIVEALTEALTAEPEVAALADSVYRGQRIVQARQAVAAAEDVVAKAKAELGAARKALRFEEQS